MYTKKDHTTGSYISTADLIVNSFIKVALCVHEKKTSYISTADLVVVSNEDLCVYEKIQLDERVKPCPAAEYAHSRVFH